MYYHFPVRDLAEAELEKQCCVIRNHSYQVSILAIRNYGTGNEKEPEEKPIDPSESSVEVEINVLDWYLITQGLEL